MKVYFQLLCTFFAFYADIYDMSDLILLSVLRRVISDYRIIAAFAAVLIYLNFIFYVARYKRRKSSRTRNRVVKVKTPVAAPAPENTDNGSGADAGSTEADTEG